MSYVILSEAASRVNRFDEQFLFLDMLTRQGPDPGLVILRSFLNETSEGQIDSTRGADHGVAIW